MGDAILWREPVAAILSPPPGWVADNEDSRPERMQVMMYPLGHSRNSAMRRGAFLYANIFLKRDALADIESIAPHHEAETKEGYPDASFQRLEPPQLYPTHADQPVKAILRRGYISPTYDGPEYTLYIDHPQAVLTLVLLCHEGEDAQFLPLLLRVGETALLKDIADQRLERVETADGRIVVFLNRARYIEVFRRSDLTEPWSVAEAFVEILEPLRLLHSPVDGEHSSPIPVSVEFSSRKIPVRPEWRIEFPGEGWGVRLWNLGGKYPRPRVVLHFDSSDQLLEPNRVLFFTSTRYPFSPDEWPLFPGIDIISAPNSTNSRN